MDGQPLMDHRQAYGRFAKGRHFSVAELWAQFQGFFWGLPRGQTLVAPYQNEGKEELVHSTDVAEHILRRRGSLPAMKLQKLVYYAQAWSLVWDDRPLFSDRIEAWANGPVCPELYERHRGQFNVETVGGNPEAIDEKGAETIEAVLKFYGDKASQWLSDLTHSENPWKDARGALPAGARCSSEITLDALAEYYGGL